MSMPSFRKSPPELVDRFAELAELTPAATRKQMFGYPTCVLGGNMFMGLHDTRMFLRLSEPDRELFTSDHGGEVFEPMPGRPMREYVVVPAAMLAEDSIVDWVRRSYEYAQQLPPKKPKAPKKS